MKGDREKGEEEQVKDGDEVETNGNGATHPNSDDEKEGPENGHDDVAEVEDGEEMGNGDVAEQGGENSGVVDEDHGEISDED